MGLPLKFNLVLVLVLVLVILAGFAATGLVSRQLLQDNAREEVLRNARLLMDRQRPAGAPPGQPDGLAWQPSTPSTPPAGRAQTPASPSVRAARRYRPLLLPPLQRRAACAAAAGLEPVHRPAGENDREEGSGAAYCAGDVAAGPGDRNRPAGRPRQFSGGDAKALGSPVRSLHYQ